MKFRKLGDSDIEVSEISLGSWLTYGGGVEQEHTEACTRAAFDAGINFFDTANVYGGGAAESVWGEVLKDFDRGSYVLATKVFFPMSETDRGLSREQIHKQIDASLERLQTDYIDLYQCHRPDPETPIEETMEALTEVCEAGKAREIGFSEWTIEQIEAGLEVPGAKKFVSSQPQYNMIWRAPEAELIPFCEQHGISQIVWSPLGQGVLTGKYTPGEPPPEDSRAASDEMNWAMDRYRSDDVLEAVQRLVPIAEGAGLSMATMALAWVLRQENLASAIIGASRPEQVHSNVEASGVELSQDILDAIDEALGDLPVTEPRLRELRARRASSTASPRQWRELVRGRPADRHCGALRLGRRPERTRQPARGALSDHPGDRRAPAGTGARDPGRTPRPRPGPARLPAAAALLGGLLRGPAHLADGRAGDLAERDRPGDRDRGGRSGDRARADRPALGDVLRPRRDRLAHRPGGRNRRHAASRRAAATGQHPRGREPLQRRHRAGRLQGRAGGGRGRERLGVAHRALEFFVDATGGIAIGLAVGWLIAEVRKRVDDVNTELTISLFSAYGAFVPADQLGVSGVLAVVTAGIYLGFRAPEIASPESRMQGFAMWSVLTFLLNATLFILIGLQLPVIVDGLSGRPAGEVVGYAAAVCAAVIAVRFLWNFIVTYIIRAIDRRPSQRARRADWRTRVVGSWAGMRGAVSLAAALALPLHTDAGAPLPGRDLIQFITFALILVTVVGEGLTLPFLIRRLGVVEEGTEEEQEEIRARLVIARAALERVDVLGGRRVDPRRHRRASPCSLPASASGASRCGRGRSTTRMGSRRARSPTSG